MRKTTTYNTNVDLVNDDEHTKFGLILLISSQEKLDSDINQGPLLYCKFAEKTTTNIYNTNVDLVNDYVYRRFGLNLSIRSQDIEQKYNSDVNQGPSVTLLQICEKQ